MIKKLLLLRGLDLDPVAGHVICVCLSQQIVDELREKVRKVIALSLADPEVIAVSWEGSRIFSVLGDTCVLTQFGRRVADVPVVLDVSEPPAGSLDLSWCEVSVDPKGLIHCDAGLNDGRGIEVAGAFSVQLLDTL